MGILHYRMTESVFDPIREHPKFKMLFDKLSANELPK